MRAIAVALVVVYHLSPKAFTGGFVGVDVFFVISGYLITSQLMKSPPRRVGDFAAFWARRIRRLLPAAFAVLTCTAVAVRLLAPDTQWRDSGWQLVSSAFYVQNWSLASSSVDYLAADNAASPVQHFWSLSVEEQFYLVWPLLIGLAVWWAVRKGRDPETAVKRAILALIVGSLAFSIYYTATDPGPAYFSTPTRMWEFAVGGLVAVLPRVSETRRLRPLRAIFAWLSIAAIMWTGSTYTAATSFPGYTAVLPVGATALVLWADARGRFSPRAVLCWRPMQYIGDISYSIYLWHWPITVMLPMVIGSADMAGSLTPPEKLVVVAIALVLAVLTKMLIEDRFRRTRIIKTTRSAYYFAALGMAGLLMAGGGLALTSNMRANHAVAIAAEAEAHGGSCFGAKAIARGASVCPPANAGAMIPDPAVAKNDKSVAYADGCWSNQPFIGRPICTYGDGPTQVALVGNSHAGQWLPALQTLAKERDWTIKTFLVSRCNPSYARQQFDTSDESSNCYDYGQWVLGQTAHGQFDLIITSERQSVPVEGAGWVRTPQAARTGYELYLKKWAASGTPVIVIRDVPYPGNAIPNIPDCLAEHATEQQACGGTPARWNWIDPLADAARVSKSPEVEVVDMTKYFCAGGVCPAVIGTEVVYFDSSHLTATYARSLSGYLGIAMDRARHG